MPTRLIVLKHVFAGGWAPDNGPVAQAPVGQGGVVEIPWLSDPTQNIMFELDGGVHKIGGTSKLNSSALESGATIRGLHDFWRYDGNGSAEQRRVVHVGTTIKADGADGTFSDIFTGLANNSDPWYAEMDDKLIISQTGGDLPRYTDGTTHTVLGTDQPNFAFSTTHKNRHWAAGCG